MPQNSLAQLRRTFWCGATAATSNLFLGDILMSENQAAADTAMCSSTRSSCVRARRRALWSHRRVPLMALSAASRALRPLKPA